MILSSKVVHIAVMSGSKMTYIIMGDYRMLVLISQFCVHCVITIFLPPIKIFMKLLQRLFCKEKKQIQVMKRIFARSKEIL